MRIAINGFGRIGRTALKVILARQRWGRVEIDPVLEHDKFEVVAINTREGLDETTAYLFKYDSVYGTYPDEVKVLDQGQILQIGEKKIPFLSESDPTQLPWAELDVDVVLECTGVFTEFSKAAQHLNAGAKRVIISANGKGEGTFVVLGTPAYQEWRREKKAAVVSNCSCTTNCAAPLIAVLHQHLEVLKGQMITVHAVTSTQSLVDSNNKNLRRSRAAFASIIPQPTGAAKAVTKVIPDLAGKLSGSAFRVPVICGSVLEVVLQVKKETSAEEINQILRQAAAGEWRHIIKVHEEGLVSSDIIGQPISTIVDLPLTEVLDLPGVVDENLVKVVAWYDNEYGYCCRLVRLAQEMF